MLAVYVLWFEHVVCTGRGAATSKETSSVNSEKQPLSPASSPYTRRGATGFPSSLDEWFIAAGSQET